MSIVESDGPPSWSLDASETGENTKCPWVGVMVEGTADEKNGETVTASLCFVFNSCGQVLAPPQILAKKPVRSGKYDINYVWHRDILKFKVFQWTYIAHQIDSMQLRSWVEWMRDQRTLLWLWKCQQRPQDACVCDVALILKFQCRKNKYISARKSWSWKNLPSRPFENTYWCWTGSTSWKIFL